MSTVVWLAVTYMTAPETDATLDAFYCACGRAGPGWARVSERLGFGRESIPGGALAWTNWIAGIVAVYCHSVRHRKDRFRRTRRRASILLVIAVVAFAWIARSFRIGARAAGGDGGRGGSDRVRDWHRRPALNGPSEWHYLCMLSRPVRLGRSQWRLAMSTMNQPEVMVTVTPAAATEVKKFMEQETSIRPRAASA